MNPEPSMLPERDERLGEILAAWIEAAERGETPDRAEWLARHAEFATELEEFLANRARLQEVTEPLCQAVRVTAIAPSRGNIPLAMSQENTSVLPIAEMIGRSVGEYDLLAVIGQGGMGLVYRARHRRLQRLVALKMLRANVLSDAGDVQRFRNEAEVLAQLDHPHIVPVHNVGEHEGRFYFSMKLIEGGGLNEQLGRFRDDPHRAARLVAQVARAVHHAHQRGILHRDLKPSNILLDREGQPHISDFGLAKRIETDASLTQTGAIVGTPQYMAPEQTSGRKGAVTTATDVYGLGAVLYALLTGKPPFQGETVLETLEQVREREPGSPRRINAKVDRNLETICLKCLAKEPARRYGSAEAVAEDLECWLRGEPVVARSVGWTERLRRSMRRHKSAVWAASVLLFALMCVGVINAIWWVQQQTEAAKKQTAAETKAREAINEAMYLQQSEKWPEALRAFGKNESVARGLLLLSLELKEANP
jgi:eukaryotic-like serine/threonine-protein kinase